MNGAEEDKRCSIIDACLKLKNMGLIQGTSGNVSIRHETSMLITPSGVPYEQLVTEDIVLMGFSGDHSGRHPPSSEWRFHRDILASRPEINAVVHTHSPYATSLAICRREIPAVHYMIAGAGGASVRCAEYATFGTPELSANALIALEGRNCCLLANHGMIALGPTLAKAVWLSEELENLSRQYVISLSIGSPHVLSEAEIEINVEKFRSYGPRAR